MQVNTVTFSFVLTSKRCTSNLTLGLIQTPSKWQLLESDKCSQTNASFLLGPTFPCKVTSCYINLPNAVNLKAVSLSAQWYTKWIQNIPLSSGKNILIAPGLWTRRYKVRFVDNDAGAQGNRYVVTYIRTHAHTHKTLYAYILNCIRWSHRQTDRQTILTQALYNLC
jgi:hypothetical protein